MGEFFTIPVGVILTEADGTKHVRADGKGPASKSWKFPVVVRTAHGSKLVAQDYDELVYKCWYSHC